MIFFGIEELSGVNDGNFRKLCSVVIKDVFNGVIVVEI